MIHSEPQRSAAPAMDGFDEVVLPHLDAAHRLARWLMRHQHDAEDVVQNASLRASRYFRTFTRGDGPAWLPKIVRIARIDDVALIEGALRGLPDRFRELLVLRELEDLSYRELAAVLEVPIGTIMSGLSRARQAFRVTLNNELTRSTPAVNTRPALSPPRAGAAVSIIERT